MRLLRGQGGQNEGCLHRIKANELVMDSLWHRTKRSAETYRGAHHGWQKRFGWKDDVSKTSQGGLPCQTRDNDHSISSVDAMYGQRAVH